MNLPITRLGRLPLALLLLLVSLGRIPVVVAHPMPTSVVLLTVHADRMDAEVQVPLNELQAAWGHAVNDSSARLIERLGPALRAYLAQHIHPESPDGRPWAVTVGTLTVHETQNPINGPYRELTAQVRLVPPIRANVRRFIFRYDAVIHQVVTHKILVSVRQDWARGQVADTAAAQVGVIELDVVNNLIHPLSINLEEGSVWTGFRAMVQLGIRHIAEGTDHLLFLLVLLLPAPLLVKGRRWSRFGGVRYSIRRLLLIVTAFTLGHSLTLLLGALGWVRLPSQPVEVLIAVSILVSAVHAMRPLFPGREAWVAAGFGLVHGLAFASTLANLRLEAGPMALSILGFNLGIELMQLGVITLTIPWLLLLSRTPTYKAVRVGGALCAALAALAWIIERTLLSTTPFSTVVGGIASLAPWLLVALAAGSLFSYWRSRNPRPAIR
ncbi:HupE/UreJ family protein [Hymenobacter sp. GOD-10R]|uniref:HupE/UreJ family protein n=1 Tax=Hymenobacter sp. GOD-10R TaxID=3093922 RepID=UPI002D792D51|nr:HupE/UreJ family protein [Hymenobacter sp. GOD-10R]WRQ31701.1 HupE/UreJ family protein [Hymenobacter sp. GOD-10R]